MSCGKPVPTFQCSDGSLHSSERAGFDYVGTFYRPCGQCAMCRQSRAAQLTTRLVHETYMHKRSCWPCLTYAPEHLDPAGSLHKRDVQLFMKQVRHEAQRRDGSLVRFDAIGEYSPAPALRPHYHVCLFGYWPPDSLQCGQSAAGVQLYESATLTRLWGRGRVVLEEMSPGAAQYHARHDSWKLTREGPRRAVPVFGADGECVGHREPEFRLCSRRPGLGAGFFDRYGDQMLAYDFTVVGGQRVPVPKYYLRRAEKTNPDRVSELKAEHELASVKAAADSTWERLGVREECARARLASKRRDGV